MLSNKFTKLQTANNETSKSYSDYKINENTDIALVKVAPLRTGLSMAE